MDVSVARDENGRVRKRKSEESDSEDVDDGEYNDDKAAAHGQPTRARKKTKRATRVDWSLDANQTRLAEAMRLHNQGYSYRQIKSQTGVPAAVLHPRVHQRITMTARPGVHATLTPQQEQDLVNFVLELADRGFGKDVVEIRRLATSMSTNPTFKATTSWWRRFHQRHPELARRRAQGFERLRAQAMNPGLIKHYFLLLQSAFAKVKELSGGMPLEAKRIYNMDEIGFMVNDGKPYFVTRRGTKHAATISFNCRVTTSLAVAVSATGFVIPPFFIVKGQRAPPKYLDAAPPDSTMEMAKKGMMTEEVFEKWVQHFLRHLEERVQKHWCLLLLDGHHSHTMNPSILKLLYDSRVYVISLPSHTTAALQLLDVAVFGPMKKHFRAAVHSCRDANPIEMLDRRDVPNLISMIWSKSFVPESIVKGAKSTGLYPLNVNWAAENAGKMKISQTFNQPSLPGTMSFANYTSSMHSLAALNLELSPDQTRTLFHRVHLLGKLPRLNAIGESPSAARFLNSEARVKRLFDHQDSKLKEALKKAAKRKEREAKRIARRAEKMKKQHAKDQALEVEKPLIRLLIDGGFQSAADGKPRVQVLKRFAQKQKIVVRGTRDAIVATLLGVVNTASVDRKWMSAEEEEESEESESEVDEPGSESSEESEASDIDDWEDFRVFC